MEICLGSKRMMEWIKDQDNQDQREVKSVEEDHVEKDWCFVPISQSSTDTNAKKYNEDVEYVDNPEDISQVQTAIWTRAETLALINLYSLHKDEFSQLKNKKSQWPLISKELLEIGIEKAPRKCEIKWRNLLRSYRNYRNSPKGRGKFDFFNELDSILTNDPRFSRSLDGTFNETLPSVEVKNNIRHLGNTISTIQPNKKKTKCCCTKTEKQKRHEDRMALLKRKVEIEERKVEAFEEYLKYLKSNS